MGTPRYRTRGLSWDDSHDRWGGSLRFIVRAKSSAAGAPPGSPPRSRKAGAGGEPTRFELPTIPQRA
jgi:hypothetical protein